MKNLLVSIIFVWYFGLRFAEGTPGAFVHIVSGPYNTAAECQIAFLQAQAAFGDEGVMYAACKQQKLEGFII